MTTYVYRAKKNSAETVSGQILAHTQDEAIDLISQLGLLPVSIEAKADSAQTQSVRYQKVKTKDICVFSRQLANLLKSGVSILRSLAILEEQTMQPYFKKVISNIAWGIKNGRSFSDCLSEYPLIFSPLYITMINAGEESGNIQEMLISISIYQQRQEEVLSKVRIALAYPILMAVVGVGTIYFILSFVLPKMASLFDNMGSQLPLPTKILLTISSILVKGWAVALIAILLIGLSIKRWAQSAQGRLILSKVFLRLPLFGEIILKSELSRFCRTVVLLMKSGVPIVRSLQIAIPILSNEVIKAQLTKSKNDLTGGGSLGENLRQSSEIPPMMAHMIAIGEESGNLNEVFNEVATTYEQETDEKIKVMTTLFEPMMILVIGLIVGFIVFAMLLPIFQMDVFAK